MSTFKKKLKAVWDHAGEAEAFRYVPRATGLREGNWRVYDVQENRFLSDADVRALSVDDLEHARIKAVM